MQQAAQRSLPESVTLKGTSHADTMKQLRVVRQYEMTDLRTNPHITLGAIPWTLRPC